jgi:hypothetical protein
VSTVCDFATSSPRLSARTPDLTRWGHASRPSGVTLDDEAVVDRFLDLTDPVVNPSPIGCEDDDEPALRRKRADLRQSARGDGQHGQVGHPGQMLPAPVSPELRASLQDIYDPVHAGPPA